MVEGNNEDLRGIGGWLILVMIGLVVSPIRIGWVLYSDYLPMFQDGTWEMLTVPGGEAYHELWKPLLAFEIAGNVITILLALITLFLLIRKSRWTPGFAIAWLLLGLVFVVADYLLAQKIPLIVELGTDPETMREIVRSIIGAAIWVPYWLVSKRVKATFTE